MVQLRNMVFSTILYYQWLTKYPYHPIADIF
nr:MAG TPA: hypothetical protein [Bacteriophage sp.]